MRPFRPSRRIVAQVWWCGDYECDCTQASIVLYDLTLRYPYGSGVTLWKGTYFCEGSDREGNNSAKRELNRAARFIRRRWHPIYHDIEWPWSAA